MSSHFLRASSPRPAIPVCTVEEPAWTRTPAIRGILKLQRRASIAGKSPSAKAKRVQFNEEPMIRLYNPSDDEPEEPKQPPRPRIARKGTGKTPDWIAALAAKDEAEKAAKLAKATPSPVAAVPGEREPETVVDRPVTVTVPVQKRAQLPLDLALVSEDGATVQLGAKLIVPVAALKEHFALAAAASASDTTIDVPTNLARRPTVPPRKTQTGGTPDSRLGLGLGPAPCLHPQRHPLHSHSYSYSLASRHRTSLEFEPTRRSVSVERTEQERALTQIVKSGIFLRHHLEGPIEKRLKLAIADLNVDGQGDNAQEDDELRKALAEAVQAELDQFKAMESDDRRVKDHIQFLTELKDYIVKKCQKVTV